MLNWKKAIVIRAFANTPDFLGRTDFLRSVDDYSRVFNKARSLGFEGVQLYLEISTGLLNLNTDEKTLSLFSAVLKILLNKFSIHAGSEF